MQNLTTAGLKKGDCQPFLFSLRACHLLTHAHPCSAGPAHIPVLFFSSYRFTEKLQDATFRFHPAIFRLAQLSKINWNMGVIIQWDLDKFRDKCQQVCHF